MSVFIHGGGMGDGAYKSFRKDITVSADSSVNFTLDIGRADFEYVNCVSKLGDDDGGRDGLFGAFGLLSLSDGPIYNCIHITSSDTVFTSKYFGDCIVINCGTNYSYAKRGALYFTKNGTKLECTITNKDSQASSRYIFTLYIY